MRSNHRLPNWFIGIPVPSSGWFEQLVPSPPAGLRLFHPDDIHATVVFLGAVDESRARVGWNALRWSLAPCSATLGPVIPMGPPGHYSALSIRLLTLDSAVEHAIELCRDAICSVVGLPLERRPPIAHATIARPSNRTSAEERAAGLRWASRIDLREHSVILDTIALYTWTEDRRVRQFRIMERSSFGQLIDAPQL